MESAWVTPQDAPGDEVCFKVWIPKGYEYEASLRGALLSLTEAENWEQVTGQAPELVADAFWQSYQKTLEMKMCAMPAGIVMAFGGYPLPEGFLYTDGAAYSPDDYPELFAAIGFRFGQAGSLFRVPDTEDRYIKLVTIASGLYPPGGNAETTLTEANLPSHNHSIPPTLETLTAPAGTVPTLIPGILPENTGNTGSGTAFSNEPPYQKFWGIISTGQ